MNHSNTTETGPCRHCFTEQLDVDRCKWLVTLPNKALKQLFWDPDELDKEGKSYELNDYLPQVRDFCYQAIGGGGRLEQHYRHGRGSGTQLSAPGFSSLGILTQKSSRSAENLIQKAKFSLVWAMQAARKL